MNRSFFALSLFPISLLAVTPEGTGHGKDAGAKSAANLDAGNAIKSFKFDAGLKAELFAAEPLLANRVAFAVDEKGRWYVAETLPPGARHRGQPRAHELAGRRHRRPNDATTGWR